MESFYKFLSVSEMIEVEKSANAVGYSYAAMMKAAGEALEEEINVACSHINIPIIIGIIGKGNNGGDGLIALRILAEVGWETKAYLVSDRPNDPLVEQLQSVGGLVYLHQDDQDLETIKRLIIEGNILLDGVLGTGIKLPVKGAASMVLDFIKNQLDAISKDEKPIVIAVDCPSGVDADSGEIAKETIPADITVCLAAVKRGLLRFPAYQYLGKLIVKGIGLPEGLANWEQIQRFVVNDSVKQWLPARPLNSHKGTYGRVMVLGGSKQYRGAPVLAGMAAFRVGAGWVTIAAPKTIVNGISSAFLEATWLPLESDNEGISVSAADRVIKNLDRVTALLIGPGLGASKEIKDLLNQLINSKNLPPLVIDADGLNALSTIENWNSRLPAHSVLTPHPGEMAKLTGLDLEVIQSDRIGIAEQFAKKWNQIVVLKGTFTVIASPDGMSAVIPVATSTLAKAGTGDVLAGMIAGFRAQGISGFKSAVLGAWYHAQAGLLAESQNSSSAFPLAGDLIPLLAQVMNKTLR